MLGSLKFLPRVFLLTFDFLSESFDFSYDTLYVMFLSFSYSGYQHSKHAGHGGDRQDKEGQIGGHRPKRKAAEPIFLGKHTDPSGKDSSQSPPTTSFHPAWGFR